MYILTIHVIEDSNINLNKIHHVKFTSL